MNSTLTAVLNAHGYSIVDEDGGRFWPTVATWDEAEAWRAMRKGEGRWAC